MVAARLSFESALLNTTFISRSIQFYNLVTMWLLRCIYVGNGHIKHGGGKTPDAVVWTRFCRGEIGKDIG